LLPGLFITFEGVEGAGKTTQISLLTSFLEQRAIRVRLTREPGGDALAETVRSLVLNRHVTPRAELLLFLASRAQNVESVIRPALADGDCVICDRYIDSSIAYQGYGRGIGRDTVARLNEFATSGLTPDLTILLDLDPAVGLDRQSDHNRMEAESLAFHQRVREGFLRESENDTVRFCVLDASGRADDLHAAIRARVEQLIDRRGGAGSL
jgi:dTMP kinase